MQADLAGLRRLVAGCVLGLAAGWLGLLCLGSSPRGAALLLGLFLIFPWSQLFGQGSLAIACEIALMLLVIGILGRAVWRFFRGNAQVLLFAALVVLYGFYGAYTLSVHTLV